MKLTFEWQGHQGTVDAECRVNDDPVALGCFPGADGLPTCTATVTFPHLGYRSMLGWVQLVRSDDNESEGDEFENDPFALFGDAPSPYCWYGLAPTLFDGPSRSIRDNLDWVAHSFLAATPLDEVMDWKPRRVVPLTGFSWGFSIHDEVVTMHPVAELAITEWNRHTAALRAQFPFWVFDDA